MKTVYTMKTFVEACREADKRNELDRNVFWIVLRNEGIGWFIENTKEVPA